jgi:flagellar protein FlbD
MVIKMVKLTRINGTVLLINEEFIETAEETPDTVVTMQNGHRYFVREKVCEIYDLAVEYQREKFNINKDN